MDSAPHVETLDRWICSYTRHAPLALCIRELNRLLALESVAPAIGGNGPVLDVGCGDGFWWTLLDRKSEDVYGVDIARTEVSQAASRIRAEVGDISRDRPFPDIEFEQIIGNCSLEHVRDIDSALKNLRSCAAPGARLVLFVPSVQWAFHGITQRMLLRRAPRISMAIAGAFNGFFQHWHLYSVPVWQRLLSQHRWTVTKAYGLGSPRSEFLFRLFLPSSFVAFLFKSVFGSYPNRALVLVPDMALTPVRRLLAWALQGPLVPFESPTAYEYMIVAEATGDGS
ncbi:class I SAM-dependent methyltransferase [Anaeromyxobacter diazotrophicus]|uniref:Methyltransferase type 11 n=1 Tax=Anaeromyxobacter diazotrophicus TaxID=2590199 RepID=A0A7I9VKV9_9BACT|nr:class I SAM-dependent methyltransferase [Anaeromyxobacter diazotrophicus]GEJ57042.1 hypothetical protein AMYX_17830 [Anaeromyxobacter diazotrophicus]